MTFSFEVSRGRSKGWRFSSEAPDLATVLAAAHAEALERKADTVQVTDAAGRLVGVFPIAWLA